MNIVLVEFPWQAEQICKNKIYLDDIIISTDPEASYNLKRNNYKYFEIHNICDHKKLWDEYKNLTYKTLEIVKVLDKHLWKFDERFKNLKWNLFDDFHLTFKISYDQLYYYIELISELIKKYNPSEITVAASEDIKIENTEMLIDSNVGLFQFLLSKMIKDKKKIKINYMTEELEIKFSKNINRHNINLLDKQKIKRKLKNLYFKLIFYLKYIFTKSEYFSVGCTEINKFKKLYPKESNKYMCYNHENIHYGSKGENWKYFKVFCNSLNNDSKFIELISPMNYNLKNIFFEVISQLSKNFDNLIKEYKDAKKKIIKINPKCLIFESTVPYFSPNIIFRKVCKDLKLPFVTWTHGGCNHYSLHGWDVCDYRLCENHISYGIHLDEILNDKKSVLNKLNLHKRLKIYPIGSPRFDFFLRKKKIKKKLKKSKKLTILYTICCIEPRNQYYFGFNREKVFSMEWEFQYQIIKLLKNYQDKYEIIIKDFPTGFPIGRGLWKSVLKDLNANKIRYVSNEFLFTDLLKISDLNIFPRISTSFFESLYFDADIFAMEEDQDIDINLYKDKLKNEIFCFNDAKKYLTNLDNYLNEGNFYKTTKENSRNYFINFANFEKRDTLLDNALTQIVNENSKPYFNKN